ncbi:MAG: hypothetical protein H0X26_06075 [Alphaproteobacteria bacterium]|nr:hypothetical protein [Alphaproteobacteria bacterium]
MNKILFNLLIAGVSLTAIHGVSATKLVTTGPEERDVKTTPRTPTKIPKPSNLRNRAPLGTLYPSHARGVESPEGDKIVGKKVLCSPSRIANSIKLSIGNQGIFMIDGKGNEIPCYRKNTALKDLLVSAIPLERAGVEIPEIIISFYD